MNNKKVDKKLESLSLFDLMMTVSEKVSAEFIRENTCGNYESTKTYVKDLLNRAGMHLVTDNQITMIVNRDWRLA